MLPIRHRRLLNAISGCQRCAAHPGLALLLAVCGLLAGSGLAAADTPADTSAAPPTVRTPSVQQYSSFAREVLSERGTLQSPQLVALITDPELGEISGIAPSHKYPGLLWVHNDSGDSARLFAVDQHGIRRATLSLRDVPNIDWEDMASFQLDGVDYLLVSDTGDNGGVRHELALHVVAEPDQLGETTQSVAWTIRMRWPDGPRDCEAVAVDATSEDVYLVSKKRIPAELWRLPLKPDHEVVTPVRVALLGGIAQPDQVDLGLNPIYGRYRSQITGAGLSPDGHRLAVLNYRRVYLYDRGADGQWFDGINSPSAELDLPWLPQAEAISFDLDGGSLWVSSERLPAPLLRLMIDAHADRTGESR